MQSRTQYQKAIRRRRVREKIAKASRKRNRRRRAS